jgi:hypothetical protein
MRKDMINTNHVSTWDASFWASSCPFSFRVLANMGRKEALNDPSANNFLIMFANLKAVEKASAYIPAPSNRD